MKFNFTKFTLPALLLAASASAFAEDEPAVVTLANGAGTVTWSQFVGVINNTIPATGKIADLPAANDSLIAYNEAEQALESANNALAAVKGEDSAESKALAKAKEATAIALGDTVSGYSTLTTKKGTFDEVAAGLNKLIEDSTANRNEIIRLNGVVDEYTKQVSTITGQITIAQGHLDDLDYKDKVTTTYPDWLSAASNGASSFSENYINYIDDESYKNVTIYCKWFSNSQTLNVAYQNPNDDTYTPVTVESFSSYIEDNTYKNNLPNIKTLRIYFGKKDADTYNYYKDNNPDNGGNGTYTITPSYTNTELKELSPQDYASKLVDGVDKITSNSNFYTTKTEKEYTDKATANQYLDEIKGYRAQLTTLDGQIKTAKGQISTLTTTNADLKTQIEDYLKSDDYLNAKGDYDDAVEDQKGFVSEYNKAVSAEAKVQKEYDDAVAAKQAEVTAATTERDNAKKIAQSAANKQARANYYNVTLTDNVTVSSPITNYGGTIFGNDKVININSNYLFGTFSGHLSNVAVNGTVFNVNKGSSYDNVARWNSTGGRFYDEDGAYKDYETLGELGFAARKEFGVDFAANKLAAKGDNTTVYNVTIKELNKVSVPQYVTVNAAKKFVSASNLDGFTIPTNNFALSETKDLKGIANVYYPDNTCDEVIIEDKVAFYAPADIEATTVTLNRKFTKGYNTVCLPFVLNSSYSSNISAVCKYDTEDTKKFWFTWIDGDIEANTPALIVAKEDAEEFVLNIPSGVTIEQTDASQITEFDGSDEDKSKSFGTFKSVKRGEFPSVGESQGYKVYGINPNTGNFIAAAATASFPAFRMVIKSDIVTSEAAAQAAPRGIGIVDEKGVEITGDLSGIGSVNADASSLTIAGGQGEIIITSDADYGKVEIYAVDGKLAAVANVIVGTTTVDVQKGLYIVMGKKVLVK